MYEYTTMYESRHVYEGMTSEVTVDESRQVYETMTSEGTVCCSVLQCVAVCCSVLQCVAVCCSVSMTSEGTCMNESFHTYD